MVAHLAGWLADEMRLDFNSFKIFYRLNDSDFCFVYLLLCISIDFSQPQLI